MTTLADAHRERWYTLRTEKQIGPYQQDFGIPTFWRQHPELGSPLGKEQDLDGVPGGKVQVFSGGVVRWIPAEGASVVTE